MLWRECNSTVITQPAHAWLAGQLVRAWGNAEFAAPRPADAVCLAAEQHDLGWHAWERAPTLNPATGRPHMFRELPVAEHTALWRRGVATALTMGRLPALLVSLHGSGLYAAFDPSAGAPDDAEPVRAFLAEQTALQQGLIADLAQDPVWAEAVQPDVLAHSRALIALTDRMSLAICGGVAEVTRVAAPGLPAITLHPEAPGRLRAVPWPFAARTVRVTCEGRVLHGRAPDEAALHAALRAAPAVTLVTELSPD